MKLSIVRIARFTLIVLLIAIAIFLTLPSASSNLPIAPTITIHSAAPANPLYRNLRIVSPPSTPFAESIPAPTDQRLPALTHDLLFVNEQGLMRWRRVTQAVETIISTQITTTNPKDEVWSKLDYALSTDHHKLLIAHGEGVVGKRYGYALRLYDTRKATITTLLTTTHYLFDIAISPDHQWAAYLLRDVEPPPRHTWWQNLLGTHHCTCGEPPVIGTIYAMHLQPPYQSQKLQVCGPNAAGHGECEGLLGWALDAQQLLWRDAEGYWTASFPQNSIRLLAKVDKPSTAINLTNAGLGQQRYLISQSYHNSETRLGVLDTQTWQLREIPDQVGRSIHEDSVMWLPDDRLLRIKPAVGDAMHHSTLELWTVDPNRTNFLAIQQVLQIPGNATIYPQAALQLLDGRIVLPLVNADRTTGSSSGLYWLEIEEGVLRKMNDLPAPTLAELAEEIPSFGQLDGSPDGAGAIYRRAISQTPDVRAFYIPADGSQAIELNTVLGDRPEQLTWLRSK